MNWVNERDILISRTAEFVRSIAAAKPETGARVESRKEPAMANQVEVIDKTENRNKAEKNKAENNKAENNKAENNKAAEVGRLAEIVPMTRLSVVPPGALREEILNRVAAFRAHQQHFLRERDAYFHAVLNKARASADSPRKSPGN